MRNCAHRTDIFASSAEYNACILIFHNRFFFPSFSSKPNACMWQKSTHFPQETHFSRSIFGAQGILFRGIPSYSFFDIEIVYSIILIWIYLNIVMNISKLNSGEIKIYPNPFSTSTTIIINDASQINNAELKIYNIYFNLY